MVRFLRLIAFATFLVHAAPAQAGDAGKLRDLLDITGFDDAVASVPASITAAMQRSTGARGKDDLKDRVALLVAQDFDPTAMMDEIVGSVADTVTDQDLDDLGRFYRGEIGRRASELEIAAQRPEMAAVVATEGRAILQKLQEDGDPRTDLYRRMISSLRIVENGTELSMNVSYAMMAGMMGSPQMPYGLSDEQMLEILAAQKDRIRDHIRETVYASIAYTYRDMSDADLRTYVSFLDTSLARELYAAVSGAYRAALLPRVKAFGRDVMLLTGARKA